MRNIMLCLLLLYLSVSAAQACLVANQYKVFPIGMVGDTVVTLDVEIHRNHLGSIHRWAGLSASGTDDFSAGFSLRFYINKYSAEQQLLESRVACTSYSFIGDYQKELNESALLIIDSVLSNYKDITVFQPQQMTYCDFRRDCKRAYISEKDTAANHLVFDGVPINLPILSDTANRFTKGEQELNWQHISSVRTYTVKGQLWGFIHLGGGHELANGNYTTNPDSVLTSDGYERYLQAEHTPDVDFSTIYELYEEPLLHHGHGYDIFFRVGE